MNDPSKNEASLKSTLAQWQINPVIDPGFKQAVWSRIESERQSDWSGFVRTHAGAVAWTLLLAALLGAVGGRERARAQAEADRATLAADYVHGLDARWMRGP